MLFLLLNGFLYCQFDPGAKQISLSHSNVANDNDVFALFNNVSCLTQLKSGEVGIFYSPSPYGLKELSTANIAYAEPFNFGTLSVGGMRYGFNLYSEYNFLLGFSRIITNGLSIGITLNYHTVKIKNYGSDYSVYADVGLSFKIIKEVYWGFSFRNINRATFGNEKDQIPSIIRTGFSYYPLKELSINCAVDKETSLKENFLFGINYDVIKYLSLRSGFSTEVRQISAGIGLHYSIFNIDYAFVNHSDLGPTHQAGVIIRFK